MRFKLLLRKIRRKLGLAPMVQLLAERFPQYEIGRGSYGPLIVDDWGDGTRLTIGSWCSIAKGVHIVLGGGHRTEWTTTFPFMVTDPALAHLKGHPVSRGDVHIGHDVWLGTDAMVLSGVTIGNGAVVAARSVVTRDVPAFAVVAGSPARVTRFRFDQQVINRLEALRWWDWSEDRIRNAAPWMLDGDVERFLDMAEAGEL